MSVRDENFWPSCPDGDLKRSFGRGVYGNAEDDRNSFRSIRPILIKILTILFYTHRIEIIDFHFQTKLPRGSLKAPACPAVLSLSVIPFGAVVVTRSFVGGQPGSRPSYNFFLIFCFCWQSGLGSIFNCLRSGARLSIVKLILLSQGADYPIPYILK